eukprot:828716-Amphidinium_carterae.1
MAMSGSGPRSTGKKCKRKRLLLSEITVGVTDFTSFWCPGTTQAEGGRASESEGIPSCNAVVRRTPDSQTESTERPFGKNASKEIVVGCDKASGTMCRVASLVKLRIQKSSAVRRRVSSNATI